MATRAVVVGASLAGSRAAASLRHHGHTGPIVVVGAEPHLPYDRPPLSKQVLVGKVQTDQVGLRVEEGLDVDWVLGVQATGLDLGRRAVPLSSGEEITYDLLVIATGSHPRRIPSLPSVPGVHYLRTLEDSIALRDDLLRAQSAVIVGAGFIGLEVASSALQMGLNVTVLEALPIPLERVLGPRMGQEMARWHREQGVDLKLGVAVDSLVTSPSGAPEGVRLADGTVVAADVVVVGIGVSPTTSWLEGSGVDLDDGVLCDERLRVLSSGTALPNVVAAGDVTRWMHPVHHQRVREEHWTNAASQGEHAAQALLAGDDAPPYGPVPYVWSDQHGVKLQFVGRALPDDQVLILEGGVSEGRFVAAYGREGRVVAGFGARRPPKVIALQKLIGEGAAFPLEL
jgi:3-phenylpropionate/trans-cinnamate dioxygenase ferredoxin reductase component